MLPLLSALFLFQSVASQTPEFVEDGGWPRPLASHAGTFSIYQPQLDKWDGFRYQAHAAAAVRSPGDNRDTFGVIWIEARTQVDKVTRLVILSEVRIPKVQFPSVADNGQAFQEALRDAMSAGPPAALSPISLDRLEASLAIGQAEKKSEKHPLKNDPPRFLFSTVPAILVSIDGAPAWKPVKGTNLQRVINTRPLLLRDGSIHYLHLYDGWLEAPALEGPWTISTNAPADLRMAQQSVTNQVDLLEGLGPDADSPKPSLRNTIVPAVHVSTVPTELIVTEGDPDYVNIPGTELLYIRNTTGNLFKEMSDQSWYVLVSGRWYRAEDLNGPWNYADPTRLPGDFGRIPDDSPKENVKASVPGTHQAEEAVIANEIPQTATVKRSGTTPNPPPTIDGPPKLEAIEDTPLQSVANASAPIIRADDGQYYLVQNGLWFVSDSPNGPWVVAASVPPSIYSIPPSSRLHYATYVYVYGSTPDVVYTGYTPGYLGVEIVPAGVVVYGTGYHYRPWIGGYWYPAPYTYGFGWGLAFTPWCGWSYGWGFGPVSVRYGFGGGWWYPRPWWGPYRWQLWSGPYRPVVWNSVNINVYQRYSNTRVMMGRPVAFRPPNPPTGLKVGTAYNSRTGVPVAGQRATVVSAFTPRAEVRSPEMGARPAGSPSRPAAVSSPSSPHGSPSAGSASFQAPKPTGNHVYGDASGHVYRQTPSGGWEHYSSSGTWSGINDAQRAQSLSHESAARGWGEARTHGFNQAQSNFGTHQSVPSGSPHGWVGGPHPGGGGAPRGGYTAPPHGPAPGPHPPGGGHGSVRR